MRRFSEGKDSSITKYFISNNIIMFWIFVFDHMCLLLVFGRHITLFRSILWDNLWILLLLSLQWQHRIRYRSQRNKIYLDIVPKLTLLPNYASPSTSRFYISTKTHYSHLTSFLFLIFAIHRIFMIIIHFSVFHEV